MRLLLTHAYFLENDPKEQEVMRPYPPLGVLYLSAYLRRSGHEVELYDSTFGSEQELRGILSRGEPGMFGIYANLITRPAAVRLISYAKQAGWTVVAGGPEPANYAPEYLAAGAAYVVPGEGELVLDRLLKGDPAPPGIIFRDSSGSIVHMPPMPLVENLDTLPWPDRERINIEQYLCAWRQRHAKGSVSLITARGCPYRCRWCSHSTYGMTHRRRSVADVAAEVEWILERYRPEMLWFADDVFTIHKGWTLKFAAELKRRGIHVPFECITRADRLDADIAEALAAMGCFRVWIGSESGSQRVLDAMERGVRTSQVRSAVHTAQAHGIAAGMFFMWGYEGEQIEDIEATAEHVAECRPDVFLTTISYPIKGTPYHAQVGGRLVHTGEWSTSTDRDVRIEGRHSRQYYRFADALLRASVEGSAEALASAREGLQQCSAEVEA